MTQLLDYAQWLELNKDKEDFDMLPITAERLKRVRGFVDSPFFEYDGVLYNCMSFSVANPDREEDKEDVKLADNVPWEDVVVYQTSKYRSFDPVKAGELGVDLSRLFYPETIPEEDLVAIRCINYKIRYAIIDNDRFKVNRN